MDQSEIKHLTGSVDLARPSKLSQAVRIGCWQSGSTKEINVESWRKMKDGRCFTCLLGAAYLGDGHGPEEMFILLESWAAKRFGIPSRIISAAHMRYEQDGQTREQVADWLEARGY